MLSAAAQNDDKPQHKTSLTKHVLHRLHQIVSEGKNELYFSGYAWHNRYTYKFDVRHKYNELAWGGGYGKGFHDEDGDWHGLYAVAFLDSHRHVEPGTGYAFLKVLNLNKNAHVGAGYMILITARPDIYHNIPFVGVLPLLSVRYRQATLNATYIPGTRHTGNVLYIIGKWTF